MTLASPLQAQAKLLELRAAVQRRLRHGRPTWRPIALTKAQVGGYREQLQQVVVLCERELKQAVESILSDWSELETTRADAPPTAERVRKAISAASRAITERADPESFAPRLGRMFSANERVHAEAMRRQFSSALGVDILAVQPQLKPIVQSFTKKNVEMISSLQHLYLDQVEGMMIDALSNGTRGPTLAKQLQERFNVARGRAELIATDQLGKLYSSLTTERHKALGIKRFRWRDAGDNRVRPAHVLLSGQIFEYGNPPSEGMPGEPVRCRCWPEPMIDDLL